MTFHVTKCGDGIGNQAARITRALLPTGWHCVIAGLALLGLSAPALAQLSTADIEALRKRGEAEGWTFTVGESEATRRPLSELCGLVIPEGWRKDVPVDPCTPRRDLPARLDWREYGGCPPVRNQGGCGSCWAFAAIGVMECSILINDGYVPDLSEQWLVSCTVTGNCNGGWYDNALRALKCDEPYYLDPCGDTGAVLEADFPYTQSDATPCNCPYDHPYCIDGRALVYGSEPTVAQIKEAILTYGAVATHVTANAAFQAYDDGVFNNCSTQPTNHAVVLVGWDDDLGPEGVWIMRNSWGPSWGESGYMYITYGCSWVGTDSMRVIYSGKDCNTNGIHDGCDMDCGPTGGLCDVAGCGGGDCNENTVPDDCDVDPTDPDGNGEVSEDCQPNDVPDECEADADGDTIPDDCDICPGHDDRVDADGDSMPDGCDGCPADPSKVEPGQCGCGVPDTDSDGDNTADCSDNCPAEPALVEPSEQPEQTCTDGVDNDCDGGTDVGDTDCQGPECTCGDLDGLGGAVNLSDFNLFQVCYGLRGSTEQCPEASFECADLNQDDWINLTDFNTFQVLFGTVSTDSPPNCL